MKQLLTAILALLLVSWSLQGCAPSTLSVKVPISCSPTDLSSGPVIQDIPEIGGGTPRDVTDRVAGQNRAAAFVYKEKHEGLVGCIQEFNEK